MFEHVYLLIVTDAQMGSGSIHKEGFNKDVWVESEVS